MKTKTHKNMNNSARFLLATALCAATLFAAGCSKDTEPSATTGNDGRVALQLTGGISAQTRAAGSSWDAGDQIGIYMYDAGTNDIAEVAENIPYVTSDGANTFSPVGTIIYFPVDGGNVDFYAWYPYAAVEEWVANLTDQSSQEAIDLMTAEALSNAETKVYHKDQPKLELTFQHRLSKLEVTIKAGNGIETTDLQGLKVEITNQTNAVTYAPGTRTLGCSQDLATVPLLMMEDGSFGEAILCPNDLAAATEARQLVFTLSNGEIFYYDIDGTKSFGSGVKNIYNITINRVSLEVTASIEDWAEGNGGGEEGSAE